MFLCFPFQQQQQPPFPPSTGGFPTSPVAAAAAAAAVNHRFLTQLMTASCAGAVGAVGGGVHPGQSLHHNNELDDGRFLLLSSSIFLFW